MPTIITENPRAILLVGGPLHTIQVNGKRHLFEWHTYCGPTKVSKRGDILKGQPNDFLEAASLWHQQGEKVDGTGLCVWFHPPKDITEHIVGRHYRFIGKAEPVKGE